MRALFRYLCLAGLTGFLVSPAFATLNFPSIASYGSTYLSQAQTYDTNFTQYAKSFSTYFGQTASFAAYLSAPVGKDNLGKFPSLYVGIGVGATTGKINQLKGELDSSLQSNAPPYLGDAALSFNFGIGFSKQWDLRFSFFPAASISLPTSLLGSGRSGSISLGVYRAKVGYNLVESSLFKPGVTLSGFLSYSSTNVSLTQTNLSYSRTDSDATTTFNSTSLTASLSGQYVGMGPEIRVWYDMKFFHPFIGYSLGLQLGQFTTALNLEGTITVTPSIAGLGAVSDTGSIVISERVASKIYTHRLMFGFEIALFVLDIGVEAQIDMVNGLVGAAVGTGFRF